MAFDVPDNAANSVTEEGSFSIPWYTWMARVNTLARSIQESGTTADRPTYLVWIGRRYYDTTLNMPVYVSSVGPVVWRDAAGNVV